MKKKILLITLTLISFVFFVKAQNIEVQNTSKTNQAGTEVLYYKITLLKSMDDAKKIDEYLKKLDYVVNANTDFEMKVCTVEAKTGYSIKIREMIMSVWEIIGYRIEVFLITDPQEIGTIKNKIKN